MTTPAERTEALIQTEKLLTIIANSKAAVPVEIWKRATGCLRHFPTKGEIAMASDECDLFAEPPKEEK